MAEEKRQLDNWLEGFLKWTLPRSESPEPMLKWAGLFTLAAVMKRKVFWPRSLMGGYEIYPNLYIVLVGDPATVRKSTTTGFSQLLLNFATQNTSIDPITFAGDVTSHSKLLATLHDSPDSSVAIISSEFSSLIQTTPEAMYEILTDIFDNKAKVKWDTWAHGEKEIENPVVNLIAATTPAWISNQPPEYFVGGGFASRILFLYEEAPRQREIYYDHVDQQEITRLGKALIHDLEIIARIKGEFDHADKETKEYIRAWYKAQEINPDDNRLKGYYGRKHVHGHKIAALLSLAERNDRKITKAHWNRAIALLDYIEKKMPQAFSSLGVSPLTLTMEGILEYIKDKGSASLQQIAGRFYKDGLTLDQLKGALAFLCTTGKVSATGTLQPRYRYDNNSDD